MTIEEFRGILLGDATRRDGSLFSQPHGMTVSTFSMDETR